MGAYGDSLASMGTFGYPLAPMGTSGGLWVPMGAHGDLWGPMGAYGDPLAHTGTYGDVSAPMWTYGVGAITFLHTHFDTPPPFVQASDVYQTHCKNNMPHQTSDIKLYTQSRHGPVRTLFLGLILCVVPMTPCETMLYWPNPN